MIGIRALGPACPSTQHKPRGLVHHPCLEVLSPMAVVLPAPLGREQGVETALSVGHAPPVARRR
jgi:hypothetical protein